jgi:hypothetical protein
VHIFDKHIARYPCGAVSHRSYNRQHIVIVFNSHPDARKPSFRHFLLNSKLRLLGCRFPVICARLFIHSLNKIIVLLKAPPIQLLGFVVILANPVVPVPDVLNLKPGLCDFLFKTQRVVLIHDLFRFLLWL